MIGSTTLFLLLSTLLPSLTLGKRSDFPHQSVVEKRQGEIEKRGVNVGWPYGSQKIRGVNLGGVSLACSRFCCERFMLMINDLNSGWSSNLSSLYVLSLRCSCRRPKSRFFGKNLPLLTCFTHSLRSLARQETMASLMNGRSPNTKITTLLIQPS